MEKRRLKILDLVNSQGELSFCDLKSYFPEVSEVTLRKDLKYLDSSQQLVRVHGGVKSLPAAIGKVDNLFTRSAKHHDEKKQIAEKAAVLLKSHASIFIAAGSTCAEFATQLPVDKSLTVFTDGIMTALELSRKDGVEGNIIGGTINRQDVRAAGQRAFEEIQSLRFDYAFIGADGFSPERGFVCCSLHSYALYKTLLAVSEKVVVLMDSSKVNAKKAARNIPTGEIYAVISDNDLSEEVITVMKKAGVEVF